MIKLFIFDMDCHLLDLQVTTAVVPEQFLSPNSDFLA